jgi:hypothetical protein
MSKTSKTFSLLVIATLAIASLMMVKPTVAQSILKPSVPEFTLKLADHSYNVPSSTTTTIDQYTGKQIVTIKPGYFVENKSIEITIKNQQFVSFSVANGHLINLYFNVRAKGHFGQEGDWKELYPYEPIRNGEYGTYNQNPSQSSSGYTVISYPAQYPDGAQIDV